MQMKGLGNKNWFRKIIIWKIGRLNDKGIKIIKSILKKFCNLVIENNYRQIYLEMRKIKQKAKLWILNQNQEHKVKDQFQMV
jgi:hypothetical protein